MDLSAVHILWKAGTCLSTETFRCLSSIYVAKLTISMKKILAKEFGRGNFPFFNGIIVNFDYS